MAAAAAAAVAAASGEGEQRDMQSEVAELMEGNEGADERFEEYESYVDAAVASLRGVYTGEMEALQVREREHDSALATNLDKLQSKLIDGVDMFLNTTVTVTKKNSEGLRNLVKTRSDAVVSAVLRARREAGEGQDAVQQKSHPRCQ